MPSFRPWRVLAIGLFGVLAATSSRAQDLDDPAEPLVPRRTKTTEDRDRIEALSLFAAGRAEQQQGNAAAALQLYQKALRYEPDSQPIVASLVEVARELDRKEDVVRYAIRALELNPSDPRLQPIAESLVSAGEFKSALKLYEKALELQKDRTSAAWLTLSLQVGQLCYLLNRNDDAADALGDVMEGLKTPDKFKLTAKDRKALEGEDGRNYELVGAAMLAADRTDEAGEAFKAAFEKSGDKASYALHRAQIAMHDDKPAEALKALDEYFDNGELRGVATAIDLLEKSLKALKKSDELVPRLEAVEKKHADSPALIAISLFLGEKYLETDNPALAAKRFEAIQKIKVSEEGYRGLVEAYTAMDDAGKLTDALAEVYEKAGGLDAVKPAVKKLVENEALLAKVVELVEKMPAKSGSSKQFNAQMAIGLVAIEAKQFDLADKMFEAAAKAKPRSRDVWRVWGLGLLQADQYDRAAEVFKRGIDSHVLAADNPMFHTYLVLAYAMADKHDDALAAAREAAEIGEHAPELDSRVAWVCYHAKRYDDAARLYKELIDKFGDDYKTEGVRSVLREARLALSNLCVIQERIPEAEEWLEQVLDEYPDDVGAMNDLGYLWADQGKNLDRSLKMVQTAVDAEPDNKAYRDSLGWALFRLGRFHEAIEQLEQAVGDADSDGVIFDHLGDAYDADKQPAKAEEAWKRGIELLKKQGDEAKAAKVTDKIKQLSKSN